MQKLSTTDPAFVKLRTDEPNQLEYQNEILHLTVLGGVKLEGLDRMRVTLKAGLKDSPRPPVRHNLDLYNDNQLDKFIRKLAERLEIGTNVITATLGELTEELEKYRLLEIENQKSHEAKAPALTKEEIKAAEDFLKSPLIWVCNPNL